MSEILTVRELADRFKVSEKTVRRAIKAGRLRAAKIGGDAANGGVWRIALADARAWFDACAATQAHEPTVGGAERRRRSGTKRQHAGSWRTLRAIEESGPG